MGEKYQRRRLHVQADNAYMRRDEFKRCVKEGCRNIIATWAAPKKGPVYCTSCRKGSR